MQWTSCLCVLVRSTHTEVQVCAIAALSSSFYLFKIHHSLSCGSWDFWWPSVQEDVEDRGKCALAELKQKKTQASSNPIEILVIVMNRPWRILSQSSLHITKTALSSHLPKWSIFLYAKGHCLHPQWPSNFCNLHGSLANAEPPVWIHIHWIFRCR